MLRAFQKTLLTSCLLMSFGSAYAVTATESVINHPSNIFYNSGAEGWYWYQDPVPEEELLEELPPPTHEVAKEETKPEPLKALKSSKAPTNYFTPNILRKSWSRLVVSVVHLDALAFPVAAT